MKLKNTLFALVGLVTTFNCWAVPIVSNVQMKQIEGTKDVRITYDLTDNFNTQLWVTVSAQPTASIANWGTNYFPMSSVEGDARCWVTPGNGKEIIWHAGKNWNGRYTDTAKATVIATAKSRMWEGNLKFNGSSSSSGVYNSTVTFLSTKVHGYGTLSFTWSITNYSDSKPSSLSYLYLYIDGQLNRKFSNYYNSSGSRSSYEFCNLSGGYHTVEWKYEKKINASGYYASVSGLTWR